MHALAPASCAGLRAAPIPAITVSFPRRAGRVVSAPLGWRLQQTLKLLLDGSYFVPAKAWIARRLGVAVAYGSLYGTVTRGDGTVVRYGLLGRRVITTAGVNYLASCFDNTAEPEVFKYHGAGTGTTAEAIGDTALVTELTTEYATDNTRPTGSQAHSTNTYTTVATLSPDSGGTLAITEHGLFSQAANSGGTLWDRTKFSAVNVVAASDSIQFTYVATFPSGG
jgi:hypothetical protein